MEIGKQYYFNYVVNTVSRPIKVVYIEALVNGKHLFRAADGSEFELDESEVWATS